VAAHVVAIPQAQGGRRQRDGDRRLLPGGAGRRLSGVRRAERLRGPALVDAAAAHLLVRRLALQPPRLRAEGWARPADLQARVPARPYPEDPDPLLRQGLRVSLPRPDPDEPPPDRRRPGPRRLADD